MLLFLCFIVNLICVDSALKAQTRENREWIFTFPFPAIPMQSIPISSHSHAQFGVLFQNICKINTTYLFTFFLQMSTNYTPHESTD